MSVSQRRVCVGGLLSTLVAFFVIGGASCDVITSVGPKSCDRSEEDNPPVWYCDGTVANGIYTSSPPDRNLLYFPGGMQIRIAHHLGAIPRTWSAQLAFGPNGEADGGALAPAAGNQVEVVGDDAGDGVNDVSITVKNVTCSDYYLLLTAQADSSAMTADPNAKCPPQ